MEFLAKTARQWGPLLAAVGAGFGVYHGAESKLRELARVQADLSQRIADNAIADRDFRAIGPGGFAHPTIRMAVEEQLRVYFAAHGCACNEFLDTFFQLNPELVRPNGR